MSGQEFTADPDLKAALLNDDPSASAVRLHDRNQDVIGAPSLVVQEVKAHEPWARQLVPYGQSEPSMQEAHESSLRLCSQAPVWL